MTAKQNSISAAYYRGGTSRALIFHQKDLPPNQEDWRPIFLGALGSPDPNGRQLDGIGGGISSLSKICIVGPSERPDAMVDYTFVQIGIRNDDIDYAGNCGNMSSAIGPFAIDSGLVKSIGDNGLAAVRIYNTNTGKLIDCSFPVSGGEAVADGAFSIDGVSGTASKVQLDFIDPAGSKTGKLLPTGNMVDVFDGIRATCVDVANPSIFVAAEDLGIDGTMLPEQIQNNPTLLQRLETIRRQATIAMGIAKTEDEVPPSIPKICFVSPPSSHPLLSREQLDPTSVDVVARTISTGQPHGAVPLTTAFGIATAAKLPGSTVQQCSSSSSRDKSHGFVIGHPSGKLVVEADVDGEHNVSRATVFRTARRLMEGKVFWK
ncbi:hypothetical protein FQN54_006471 [Arachnomyces sp. PD_36]|nr:hypothetical protein FQN54_006471 [Arachnomyces sp. PD_36]